MPGGTGSIRSASQIRAGHGRALSAISRKLRMNQKKARFRLIESEPKANVLFLRKESY